MFYLLISDLKNTWFSFFKIRFKKKYVPHGDLKCWWSDSTAPQSSLVLLWRIAGEERETCLFMALCLSSAYIEEYFFDKFISSGLKVSSTQGSLQRSEVATTSTSFLPCQNVKLLPIIASSQEGADNYDRQATWGLGHLRVELDTADRWVGVPCRPWEQKYICWNLQVAGHLGKKKHPILEIQGQRPRLLTPVSALQPSPGLVSLHPAKLTRLMWPKTMLPRWHPGTKMAPLAPRHPSYTSSGYLAFQPRFLGWGYLFS